MREKRNRSTVYPNHNPVVASELLVFNQELHHYCGKASDKSFALASHAYRMHFVYAG